MLLTLTRACIGRTAKDGKLCGASDEVRPIHVRVRVTIVTTQETGRDTSAQMAVAGLKIDFCKF